MHKQVHCTQWWWIATFHSASWLLVHNRQRQGKMAAALYLTYNSSAIHWGATYNSIVCFELGSNCTSRPISAALYSLEKKKKKMIVIILLMHHKMLPCYIILIVESQECFRCIHSIDGSSAIWYAPGVLFFRLVKGQAPFSLFHSFILSFFRRSILALPVRRKHPHCSVDCLDASQCGSVGAEAAAIVAIVNAPDASRYRLLLVFAVIISTLLLAAFSNFYLLLLTCLSNEMQLFN